jgi:phenylpropionate dioxygenase-like ring-hydroxylating dioxygenase large terminal subunit
MTLTTNILPLSGLPKLSPGLPKDAYFSQEHFEQEQRLLWSKTWQWVARESELTNPGDYVTCVVAQQPLLVIRTQSGTLQAMYNVCPHRGAQILQDKGHCHQRIRCAYHAWNFDFEGNLRGLPQPERFPSDIKATTKLAPVQVDTWGGFVFVNLDTNAESLADYMAGFTDYLETYEYAWEDLQQIDLWSYHEPVNWKFSVENYCECYHLPVVHAQSLKCFDPGAIQYTPKGKHYQIEVPWTESEAVEHHPSFAGKPKRHSLQGLIFPNMMINTAKDMVSVFYLTPLTPETTLFEVFIYQSPQQQVAFPYQQEAFRKEFNGVLMEDFEAVRMLQTTLRSQYRPITLAEKLEYGITHFHQSLSQYL